MILASLSDSSTIEAAHPRFKAAFDFIRTSDLLAMPLGKVAIDGENIFAIISHVEAKTAEEAILETHKKYIDIQIPLSTYERYGWKCTQELKNIAKPYNEQDDYALFADRPSTIVKAELGEFVIFFPSDAHAPCIGEGTIKKIVIKIAV